jgi:hypothetical protein
MYSLVLFSPERLSESCLKDEGPGLKRLGSPWQEGICLPDIPPQIGDWPGPHRPDGPRTPATRAAVPHCLLAKPPPPGFASFWISNAVCSTAGVAEVQSAALINAERQSE